MQCDPWEGLQVAQDTHRLLRLGIQELGGGSPRCQVVIFCHYFRPQQAEEGSRMYIEMLVVGHSISGFLVTLRRCPASVNSHRWPQMWVCIGSFEAVFDYWQSECPMDHACLGTIPVWPFLSIF